jgi:photosystem II stability/assembly factor-like uncharacterized protein
MSSRAVLALAAVASLGLAACTGGSGSKSDRPAPASGQAPSGPPARAESEPRLRGVDAVDARTAYVYGTTDDQTVHSVVYKTTDGGVTWIAVLRVGPSEQQAGAVADLEGLDFADASNGAAIDGDGALYATSDGGATWQAIGGGQMTKRYTSAKNGDDLEVQQFGTIAFAGARNGWAGGSQDLQPPKNAPRDAQPRTRPVIVRTTDSGATWKTAKVDPETPSLSVRRIAAATSQDVWAVCGYDEPDDDVQKDVLLASKDGGATWKRVAVRTGLFLMDVAFADALHGVLVGALQADDAETEIFATTDGGSTWASVAKAPAALYAVRFADAQHGWAVGAGGTILATTDGGTTWTAQTLGDASAGVLVQKPDQTDASDEELEALFYAIALVEPGRGWVATDEGIFEYRRRER